MTGSWNRQPGSTAADVNLDAAPHGFRVTGDAAWDSDSADYAMFSDAGNKAVAELVAAVRDRLGKQEPEDALKAWMTAEKERLAAAGHREVFDTMVRETIAYALEDAWQEAYGHRYPDWF